jgi:hypothetical protein
VRAGYDSAPYRVVRRDGRFEVRDYPALVLVETPMHGSDDSFMRLFRFIGGNNAAKQKISMTTPVFMSGTTTNTTMAFVMPKNLTPKQRPSPMSLPSPCGKSAAAGSLCGVSAGVATGKMKPGRWRSCRRGSRGKI